MALITDGPDDLNQGSSTAAPTAVWSASSGSATTITDAGNLPALAATEFFEVRDHSVAGNNGLYQVTTVTTSTTEYICKKISGISPVDAGSELVTLLGATGASKQDSVKLFPNTDIKGGVAITLRDINNKTGGLGGVFLHFDELKTILNKVKPTISKSISDIMESNTSYKYNPSIYKENSYLRKRVSGGSIRYLSSSVFEDHLWFPPNLGTYPRACGIYLAFSSL